MTTRQLIHTVTLGLSLATESLTPAHAASQRTTAAEVKASRKRLLAYQESYEKNQRLHDDLGLLLGRRANLSDSLKTLLSHHQTVAEENRPLRLLGNDADAIEMDQQGQYLAVVGGQSRPAQADDLLRHGIDSEETLLKKINERTLAAAGVKGKYSNEAAVSKAIERLKQESNDAQNLAYSVRRTEDVGLLEQHHRAVTMAKGIDTTPAVALESGLVVQQGRLINSKTSAPPSFHDLAALGLGSNEKFERFVSRVLLKRAGVKGDPRSKESLERARKVLRKQMQEVGELQQLVLNPSASSEDLVLLTKVHEALAVRGHTPVLPVVLASKKDESLEVEGRLGAILLVRRNGNQVASSTRATIADLHRFGLDSRGKFKRAVGRAMTNIAPEDLKNP